eukprot:COSAG05_NODE_5301_length_1211_cov_1.701439_1_plen_139_part_10
MLLMFTGSGVLLLLGCSHTENCVQLAPPVKVVYNVQSESNRSITKISGKGLAQSEMDPGGHERFENQWAEIFAVLPLHSAALYVSMMNYGLSTPLVAWMAAELVGLEADFERALAFATSAYAQSIARLLNHLEAAAHLL